MIVLPLITSFFWGISSIFDSLSLRDFPPIMTFIICGFIYFIVSFFILLVNNKKLYPYFDLVKYRNAWIYAILAGLCVACVGNLIYLHALKSSLAPYLVVALSYSAPIFTLLVSVLVLKHDYSLSSILGVILVVTGVFVISFHK